VSKITHINGRHHNRAMACPGDRPAVVSVNVLPRLLSRTIYVIELLVEKIDLLYLNIHNINGLPFYCRLNSTFFQALYIYPKVYMVR